MGGGHAREVVARRSSRKARGAGRDIHGRASGEFDKSADALQIALDLEPNGASSKFLLALARFGQRRFDEARALLLQVPVSDPSYRSAQERLKQIDAQK